MELEVGSSTRETGSSVGFKPDLRSLDLHIREGISNMTSHSKKGTT